MQRKLTDWGGNIAAFALVLIVNGLANSLPLGGVTTGQVSASYPSLFTPAGFTFAIWGVIYLSLFVFVVYQALPSQRQNRTLAALGIPFVVTCVANAAWIFVWHYDLLAVSVLIMLVLLVALIRMYSTIAQSELTTVERFTIALPFSLYTGWITLATIANISALQINSGWDDVAMTAVQWTLLKLAVAAAVGATMVTRYRDIAFVLVVAWAAWGIAAKQVATPAVAGAATAVCWIALMLAAADLVRRAYNKAAS